MGHNSRFICPNEIIQDPMKNERKGYIFYEGKKSWIGSLKDQKLANPPKFLSIFAVF